VSICLNFISRTHFSKILFGVCTTSVVKQFSLCYLTAL
jgi:hypothetical protein